MPETSPCFSIPAILSSFAVNLTPDDVEKLQVLGHGNGGTVYKVRHKRTSAIHALKVIHGSSDPMILHQVRREIDILRRTTDLPNIVKLHGFFKTPSSNVGILQDYIDLGALETLMKNNGTLSESQLATVARQVLAGLSYLHANKIIHHDIKPSNLLVNQKMEVKICDFGVSKVMSRTLQTCNYLRVRDPEWTKLMYAICFDDSPTLPESTSAEFWSFMECCLKKESTERWTALSS